MSQSKKGEKPSFENLGISPSILDQLAKLKFVEPTPIQQQAIPIGIKGEDLVGIAQTGTGKTFAFAIPMIQQLGKMKGKGLILAPTRELALQVEESVSKIGRGFGLRTVVLIGGASIRPQIDKLRKKPHIIIATPGRLIDHMEQKTVSLTDVSVLVLDEADRMLDMGFMPQIKKILTQVPEKRQTMLFSATMPAKITQIARAYMKNPVRVEVAPAGTASENVTQEVYLVETRDKTRLLDGLLKEHKTTALVFTRTKYRAKKVTQSLRRLNYTAAEIHSNRSLNQRREALEGFKKGKFRVLVATDIASRGIDVKEIGMVVNYDLPDQNEDYVHRIGRTGRAGHKGLAVSFVAPDQKRQVVAIERLIRIRLDLKPLPELPEHKDLQKMERSDFKDRRSSGGSRGYGGRSSGGRGGRSSGGRSSGGRSSGGRSGGGYQGSRSSSGGSSSGGRSGGGYKGSNPRSGGKTSGYQGSRTDGPRKKTRRSQSSGGSSRSRSGGDAGYTDSFLSNTSRGQTKYTRGNTGGSGRSSGRSSGGYKGSRSKSGGRGGSTSSSHRSR